MGKVTVTKVQADAIELLLEINGGNKERTLRAFLNEQTKERKWDTIRFKSLDETKTEVFIKALYIGYEIEPEFKVGEWVTHQNGYVSRITRLEDGGGHVFTDYKLTGYPPHNEQYLNTDKTYFRHATPEEIAEEKQRRFWHENGREIGEYKVNDVLSIGGSKYTWVITDVSGDIDGSTLYRFDNDIGTTHKKAEFLDRFNVVCFAHDRKDIKND